YTGYQYEGPAAVRYPRGTGPGAVIEQEMTALPIGKARVLRPGKQVAILAFGNMVTPSLQVAETLGATLVDMRFVKPLDGALILEMAARHELIVTVEENCLTGGAGSRVGEFLAANAITRPLLHIGLPDSFIEHGKPAQLHQEVGLDSAGILRQIQERLQELGQKAASAGGAG